MMIERFAAVATVVVRHAGAYTIAPEEFPNIRLASALASAIMGTALELPTARRDSKNTLRPSPTCNGQVRQQRTYSKEVVRHVAQIRQGASIVGRRNDARNETW